MKKKGVYFTNKKKILFALIVSLLFCGIERVHGAGTASADTPLFSLNEEHSKQQLPYLSLKTNLLSDCFLIPNIGAEVSIYRGLTISGSYHNIWLRNRALTKWYRFEILEAEISYYLNKDGIPFRGHHVGIYGQMQTWDITFRKQGHLAERWAYGGGVSYGYTMPIVKSLNLDFEVGLGYLHGRKHNYKPQDGHRVWESDKLFHWVGPSKIEASLQWVVDFNEWRLKRK